MTFFWSSVWHSALYEHTVLPFRYKSGGPPFCSGMEEQCVRTRQNATLVSLLSFFAFISYVLLSFELLTRALEWWSGRAERTYIRQRRWRPRVKSSKLNNTYEIKAKKKEVGPMWHSALYEHTVLPFRYTTTSAVNQTKLNVQTS